MKVHVRIKEEKQQFYGELRNDAGQPFANTFNYARRGALRIGLDRFFGKGNWVEDA